MALYLSENDIRTLLTPELALASVRYAHLEFAAGRAIDIPRARTRLPQTALHILQGALSDIGVIGYKAYTSNRSGNRFLVHLFDAQTGQQLAMLEANLLGMMRTGAASGVAAQCLCHPTTNTAAVFGAGWQAEGHILAIATALPQLDEILVYSRHPERSAALCQRLQAQVSAKLTPATSAQSMVEQAQLIGTVTTSAKPLFEADWLQVGTHINAAGSNALIRQELSEATLRRCQKIVVDSVDVALQEAGDLLPLLEKGRIHHRQLIELGEILLDPQRGRCHPDEITVFESQGMAIQDLALAHELYLRAQAAGLGHELTLP